MTQQKDLLRNWLAIAQTPALGSGTFHKLLAHFGTPEAILAAGETAWRDIQLSEVIIQHLKSPDWQQADKQIAWQEKEHDIHILCLADPDYPDLLKEIPDAPPVLYIRGSIDVLTTAQIAMVGSRNPSHGGLDTAFEFASHLATQGFSITSGMALGIDAQSHLGALSVSGKTIAVVGTGLDRVYPAKNREIAHKIIENGAIVSEFAPGTPPLPANFPRRNRIISGLSMGVLVIEAALKSGSLITARLALEQGREVFAVPGSIHHPLAKGCHALIRQGAKLVESADHIFEELGGMAALLTENMSKEGRDESPSGLKDPPAMDAEYKAVLQCVDFAPTSVDKVVERSGLTAEAVCSMLLVLELQGYVKALSGGYYSQHR